MTSRWGRVSGLAALGSALLALAPGQAGARPVAVVTSGVPPGVRLADCAMFSPGSQVTGANGCTEFRSGGGSNPNTVLDGPLSALAGAFSNDGANQVFTGVDPQTQQPVYVSVPYTVFTAYDDRQPATGSGNALFDLVVSGPSAGTLTFRQSFSGAFLLALSGSLDVVLDDAHVGQTASPLLRSWQAWFGFTAKQYGAGTALTLALPTIAGLACDGNLGDMLGCDAATAFGTYSGALTGATLYADSQAVVTPVPVPEPDATALVGLALGALAWLRRRRP